MLDQDQYWLGHLKAIDASGTTTKDYGKLHGLNVRSVGKRGVQRVRLLIDLHSIFG